MRILIVDEQPTMHTRYRTAFAGTAGPVLTFSAQGGEAAAEVGRAVETGAPYAVALIDMDAAAATETARLIRGRDADIELILIGSRTDATAANVSDAPEKLFHIAKPFEDVEIRQAGLALAARWTSDRALASAQAQVMRLEQQVAELAANESRALHMAMHDPLTDAPNRAAFQRALGERVKRASPFAAAMIDLDRFKLVNDTLGHLAGDALIREICAILIRTAPEGAMVARLGGDEFGILFTPASPDEARTACERMLAACATSMIVFGHQVLAGASAGLVLVDGNDGRDPLDVMRRADLALNDAKRAGKGVVRLFDDGMDEGVRFRRTIEDRLHRAMAAGELSLAYQPIVSHDALAIVGFEALVRWDTPDHGPISPAIFIPVAEESNVIHELGDWILDTALAEVAEWPGQYVSVNFSPRQFRRSHFVDRLVEAVERAGISPSRVQIEITETAIFDGAVQAADTLRQLRELGFRIALDDFGTGYSSLHNIRTFALDSLKIDRSFIDGMGRERESAAIVHSIIHLGRALGLGVIAEGVESEAQVQALRIAGAGHLQGYFFSRPVQAEVARAMAEQGLSAEESVRTTGTHH